MGTIIYFIIYYLFLLFIFHYLKVFFEIQFFLKKNVKKQLKANIVQSFAYHLYKNLLTFIAFNSILQNIYL